MVMGIHQEDNAINSGEVIAPELARGLVTAEIIGAETDLPNDKLLRVRVEGRVVRLHAVVLHHLQQGGLACVIEPKEKNARILMVEAEVAEHSVNPIKQEHRETCVAD